MHNDGVVMAVNVCVDSVQPLQDLLDGWLEVFWEGDADAAGEDGFVVDVRLHPSHQVFDVGWGGHLGGFGVASCSVLPKVFEFVGGFHFRAGLRGAEFGDAAVQEVDLVVEIDDWGASISGKNYCGWTCPHH